MHRIEETVERGICIGCGVCGVATKGAIPIKLSTKRMYQADLSGVPDTARRLGSQVCPFSDESPNEDILDAPHPNPSTPKDGKLGRVISTYAGRVNNESYLTGSSSGGLTSWLIQQLIEDGHADAVIKVGSANTSEDELFAHSITELDGAIQERKSQYYATTLYQALSLIENDSRRFILVGVPCFVRAARALCLQQPEYSKKLVFFISLVCGHFKTQAFAESLAWQVGVHPQDLKSVDFRIKNLDRPSSIYNFGAQSETDGQWRVAETRSLVGGNWGHNAFQPEACNFCDDVVGETADVSFGDAWLSKYTAESRGTNVVISRSSIVDNLLHEGKRRNIIELDDLSQEDAILSQAGGFRHRREGLAVRLADDIERGLSVPEKRVVPDKSVVSAKRRRLIRQRRKMASQSQALFAEAVNRNDLGYFIANMNREIAKYQNMDSRVKRVLKIVRSKLLDAWKN